jgi:hypothetical protein
MYGLHQPIAHGKKVEMWDKAYSHYCGDQPKCDHPAYQSDQWKNGDTPEAQASLRWYLAEGSTIIQKLAHASGQHKRTTPFML